MLRFEINSFDGNLLIIGLLIIGLYALGALTLYFVSLRKVLVGSDVINGSYTSVGQEIPSNKPNINIVSVSIIPLTILLALLSIGCFTSDLKFFTFIGWILSIFLFSVFAKSNPSDKLNKSMWIYRIFGFFCVIAPILDLILSINSISPNKLLGYTLFINLGFYFIFFKESNSNLLIIAEKFFGYTLILIVISLSWQLDGIGIILFNAVMYSIGVLLLYLANKQCIERSSMDK